MSKYLEFGKALFYCISGNYAKAGFAFLNAIEKYFDNKEIKFDDILKLSIQKTLESQKAYLETKTDENNYIDIIEDEFLKAIKQNGFDEEKLLSFSEDDYINGLAILLEKNLILSGNILSSKDRLSICRGLIRQLKNEIRNILLRDQTLFNEILAEEIAKISSSLKENSQGIFNLLEELELKDDKIINILESISEDFIIFKETLEDSHKLLNENTSLLKEHIKNTNEKHVSVSYYQEKLGEVYENNLNNLIDKKILGNETEAWKELHSVLEEDLEKLPDKVAAAYYLLAAEWSLDDLKYKKADNYIKLAKDMYEGIDIRAYRARKMILEEKYDVDSVMSILRPLNRESVLNIALYLLVKEGRGGEIDKILKESNNDIDKKLTNSLIAQCYLQNRNFPEAEAEIEKSLRKYPKSPRFNILAGNIKYWQGMPDDMNYNYYIVPVFIEPDIIHLSSEQLSFINDALEYYKLAEKYAKLYNNLDLVYEAKENWLLAASITNNEDINENIKGIALDLIEEESFSVLALLYLIENNISFDTEKIIKLLKQIEKSNDFNIYHVSALIKVYIKINDLKKAIYNLKKYKHVFKKAHMNSEWLDLIVESYIKNDDIDLAKQMLREPEIEVDEVIIKRLKCFLYEYIDDKNNLFTFVKKLAEDPGERIDLRNAVYIYRRHEKWEEVIKYSKNWVESYKDYIAAELLAEAYFMKKSSDPQKSIDILDQYKSLFPAVFSFVAEQIRMNSFSNLGKLDDAINIAEKLWKKSRKVTILHRLSNLYIRNGETSKAIYELREGVKKNIYYPETLLMLASLLVGTNPEESFKYAKRIIDEYEDEIGPEIYFSIIDIGYRTNHDNEASKLLNSSFGKFPDNNVVKMVSIKDVIDIQKNYIDEQGERYNLFTQGKIPIHILSDMDNSTMATYYYLNFNYNKIAKDSKYNIPIRFGGKRNKKIIKNYSEIIMDYSSCIIAHELDIINVLKDKFEKIIVPQSLFAVIQNEQHLLLNRIQPSRIELKEKALSILKHLDYEKIYRSKFKESLSTEEFYLKAANKYDAFIVKDKFSFEVVENDNENNKRLLDSLNKKRVYVNEVISALKTKGEILSLPDTFSNGKNARKKITDELMIKNTAIIIDEYFLEVLVEHNLVSEINDNYKLFLIDDLDLDLEAEIESYHNLKRVENKLKDLLSQLRKLREDNILVFSKKNKDIKNHGIHTELLYEIFQDDSNDGIPLWIDDRFITSYSYMNNSPILGVHEVLKILYNEKIISIEMYRDKLYHLYNLNTQYCVPDSIYLFEALKEAKINSNDLLEETKWLKAVRKMVAFVLDKGSLNLERFNHNQYPEKYSYLLDMDVLFKDIIIKLWMVKDKDLAWKIAASDWLYTFMRFGLDNLPYISIKNMLVIYQAKLILFSIDIIMKDLSDLETSKEYLNWLFIKLETSWTYKPEFKIKVMDYLIDFLIDINNNYDKTSAQNNLDKYFREVISIFINSLPLNIGKKLSGNKRFIDILDYREISIKFCNINIPEDIWQKWIIKLLQKDDHKITEKYNGINLNMTFDGNIATNQLVYIESENEKGEKNKCKLYEPFIQLEYGTSKSIKEWLKQNEKYLLLSKKEYSEFIINIDEETFNIDEEVKKIIEISPDFFFDQLKFLLSGSINKLPDEEYIFPENAKVFETYFPFIPGGDNKNKKWDYIDDKNVHQILDILAGIPTGEPWSLNRIITSFLDNNVMDSEEALKWCLKTLKFTNNPVKIESILLCLFRIDTDLKGIEAEVISVFEKLLDTDDAYFYKLYIVLIKIAWCFMERRVSYKNNKEKQRILWSYLYADKVLNIFKELINEENDFRHSIKTVYYTFNEVHKQLLASLNPLRRYNSYDISHPLSINLWRIMVGGTMEIINSIELSDLLGQKLYELIQKYDSHLFTKGEYTDGIEEIYLSFTKATNIFNNWFGENGFTNMKKFLNRYNNEDIIYNPIKNSLSLLNQSDDSNILNALYVITKFPISEPLIDKVKELLNNYRIINWKDTNISLNESTTRWNILVNAINSLSYDERKLYRNLYKNDLKVWFKEKREDRILFIDFLLRMNSLNNTKKTSENIINILEEFIDDQIITNGLEPSFHYVLEELRSMISIEYLEKFNKIKQKLMLY
ncbi:MAG: hypothetical protein FH762_19865 [Firmicutes bacterium]|nr:hypothetical protein [Bacillota bacterium]